VLGLADRWIWDSWTADDGERHHLFFLRAPSALGDPALPHTAARGPARDRSSRPTRSCSPAPLVQRRDGSWATFGFQHTESEGVLSFALGDPIAVGLDAGGYLTAR
jgi:hypothetical protein